MNLYIFLKKIVMNKFIKKSNIQNLFIKTWANNEIFFQ